MTTTSHSMLYDSDSQDGSSQARYNPHHNLHPTMTAVAASRQYQTAQRLRHAIGANKVWACDRCYRLKIKCDSVKPACSACTKHDLEHSCTYGGAERTNGSSRRGRRYDTTGYVRMLEARVREVEGMLQDKKQPAPLERRGIPTDRVLSPDDPPHIAHAHPLHTDPWSRTARYTPPRPTTASSGFRTSPPPEAQSPTRTVPHELFSPELQYDLCRIFFDDFIPMIWSPPFHERTFFPNMCLERQEHSEFLVTTICALAAPYSNHVAVRNFVAVNQLPPYCAGEAFYEKAVSMVNDLTSSPSVDLIVGLFWLGASSAQMGKDGSVKQGFLKQALNFSIALNLNVDPDVEEVHGVLPWLTKEIRRRVWWTLCSLDIINSLPNADKAPSISDQDHPVTDRTPCLQGWRQTPRAPAPEALFQSVMAADGLPRMSAFVPSLDFDCAEKMVSLTKLFGHIKVLRGSAWAMAQRAKSQSPEGGTLSKSAARRASINHLETELCAWFATLPEWAQAIDRVTQFVPNPTSQNPPPWQLVTLHLFYHAAHISLHLPTMLDSEAPNSPHSDDAAEEADIANAHNICLQHTQRASFLLTKVRDVNPTSRWLGPWSALFAFYSALVLVITLKTAPPGRYRDDVRSDLDAHISLIRSLATKWYSCHRTLLILMSIVAEDEEEFSPTSIVAPYSQPQYRQSSGNSAHYSITEGHSPM
ncbi:hypothetical protein PhCBS80983_g06066 [Powellomyces hirtus]|uniref:Zn(2)-C6 fungal-type domain-containing protein n=1 Tax=Powellomyces hirtus TaxID=109895 RepID=A0A507DS04_9FUNG|nr:hypothetical protein PhCBS80983_g06066 [Powellomyces hirtus]